MTSIKKNARAALRIYKEAVKEHENPPLAPILALVKEGVDVHATDNIGWTLLHFASQYGHWDVCVELIKQHQISMHEVKMARPRCIEELIENPSEF